MYDQFSLPRQLTRMVSFILITKITNQIQNRKTHGILTSLSNSSRIEITDYHATVDPNQTTRK